MMQRITIFLALIIGSAWPVAAQTPASYQVDNFDFANAVQIQNPKVETPKKPAQAQPKRLVQRTSLTINPSLNANPSLNGFTTGNTAVDNYIVESGKRNSVDPLLLYSIMHQESSFKPRAMSHKGARGLMQLMPFTASRFGVTNIWDPKQNIEGGARYMRFLLDLFEGDVRLALAGYNAGEGAVKKYGYKVPPYSETQEYVRRIGKRYSMIRDPESAITLNGAQLAAAQKKDPTPLNIYERSVFMARLPDGRLQLISQ